MTLNQFLTADDNEVIEYAVYRDSLVYLFKLGSKLRAGILTTFNSAIDPLGNPLYVNLNDGELPRKATKEDFKYYRVNCKGYAL